MCAGVVLVFHHASVVCLHLVCSLLRCVMLCGVLSEVCVCLYWMRWVTMVEAYSSMGLVIWKWVVSWNRTIQLFSSRINILQKDTHCINTTCLIKGSHRAFNVVLPLCPHTSCMNRDKLLFIRSFMYTPSVFSVVYCLQNMLSSRLVYSSINTQSFVVFQSLSEPHFLKILKWSLQSY